MKKIFDTNTSWVGEATGSPGNYQVFLRRQCGSAQVVVCVGLNGYDYNRQNKRIPEKWNRSTKDYNIHFAANAGAQFSFREFEELETAIFNAHNWLLTQEL
jgi:hypothetical protein